MNSPADCYHCGEPVPAGSLITARIDGIDQPMCCVGCKAVAEFIIQSGLAAFYEHRESPDASLGLAPEESNWLPYDSDDLLHRYVHSDGEFSEATIDIGGMYCSACVWLFDNALKRLPGIESMMFAVALYAGDYFGIEGAIEKFLRTTSLLVTVPIVFYSARPFFAAAWRGMRARSPGMDLPVSVAIIAAFSASTYATWVDRGDIYFDSVAMFVFFLSATCFRTPLLELSTARPKRLHWTSSGSATNWGSARAMSSRSTAKSFPDR